MDPFDTLGLPPRFELDRKLLEQRFRELQRALHPDRHASAPASHRRMNLARAVEVNEAYAVLKDELRRAQAVLRWLGDSGAHDPADPEFLMEVMELREALGEAKASGDLEAVTALAGRVGKMRSATRAELLDAFAGLRPGEDTATARALVARLRYFKRFLDEVAVIEEEALG